VATIEAEREFVEVGGQVLGGDAGLVGAGEPPLEQAGDPVDARQDLVGAQARGLDGLFIPEVGVTDSRV